MGLETAGNKVETICNELGIPDASLSALCKYYTEENRKELAEKLGLSGMDWLTLYDTLRNPSEELYLKMLEVATTYGLKEDGAHKPARLFLIQWYSAQGINRMEESLGLPVTKFTLPSLRFEADARRAYQQAEGQLK